jgi:uncharacterized membrane protein YbhN (UPF0104 family)
MSRLKLLIPTVLGLGVIYYLFSDDFYLLGEMDWTQKTTISMFAALFLVFIRDAAYVIRLKILAMGALSWRSSFNSVMLWEFASAVTPTIVGGSAFAILILKREGLSVGRSVATVLVTAVMDELFYVIAVPTMILIVGLSAFFPEDLSNFWVETGVTTLFYTGYFLTCVVSAIILSALFIAPAGTRKLVLLLFQLPLIRKWYPRAERWTEDWLSASENLKGKPFQFWAGAAGATLVSWSARFLTLNAILYAFMEVVPHGEVIAKQLGMWIVLLLSPTPGASGIAEIAFPTFIGSTVNLATLGIVVLIWRFLTYFIYLILGAIMFPNWIANTSGTSSAKP